MNDLELLRTYQQERAEEAFSQLVDRYLNLVYSAALRQVRSPELAEEIAQVVFSDLAENGGKLKPGTILSAWLYEVTRRTAIDVIRKEVRRQKREQAAVCMSELDQSSPEWAGIEGFLDEALSRLNRQDRAAVLLRYFEERPHREVGQALGISEWAAQKRVERAVEQLRKSLSGRGIQIGAASLGALISINAVQAAPAGVGAAICAKSVGMVHLGAAYSVVKGVTMTAVQKTFVVAGFALALGTITYQTTKARPLEVQKYFKEITPELLSLPEGAFARRSPR